MQKAGKFMLKFLSADSQVPSSRKAPHWLHVIPVLHYSTDHNLVYQVCDHLCKSICYKMFLNSCVAAKMIMAESNSKVVQSYSKQTLA